VWMNGTCLVYRCTVAKLAGVFVIFVIPDLYLMAHVLYSRWIQAVGNRVAWIHFILHNFIFFVAKPTILLQVKDNFCKIFISSTKILYTVIICLLVKRIWKHQSFSNFRKSTIKASLSK
jgi:hypothetical protein